MHEGGRPVGRLGCRLVGCLRLGVGHASPVPNLSTVLRRQAGWVIVSPPVSTRVGDPHRGGRGLGAGGLRTKRSGWRRRRRPAPERGPGGAERRGRSGPPAGSSSRSPSGDALGCTSRRTAGRTPGRLDRAEPGGNAGPVRQRRDLALGVRVVVGAMGAGVGLGDPRSASRNATGVEVIELPRSACTVRVPGRICWLAQVAASSRSASAAWSAWATIQPTTERLTTSTITYR